MPSNICTRLQLKIEFDREEDGRWIADVPALPGVLAYGESQDAAKRAVYALALRVLAERAERNESLPPQIYEARSA